MASEITYWYRIGIHQWQYSCPGGRCTVVLGMSIKSGHTAWERNHLLQAHEISKWNMGRASSNFHYFKAPIVKRTWKLPRVPSTQNLFFYLGYPSLSWPSSRSRLGRCPLYQCPNPWPACHQPFHDEVSAEQNPYDPSVHYLSSISR